MEHFDLYDINRRFVGRQIRRGEKIPRDLYHIVVHLCVFDRNGRLLIQRRRDDKEGFPGLWDFSVGGSALQGEVSLDALKREAMEELGFSVPGDPVPVMTMMFSEGFDDYYIVRADPKLSDLVLQKEEVTEVRWASQEEVLELIDGGRFIPYRPDMIRLLWDMLSGDGAFSASIPQFGKE